MAGRSEARWPRKRRAGRRVEARLVGRSSIGSKSGRSRDGETLVKSGWSDGSKEASKLNRTGRGHGSKEGTGGRLGRYGRVSGRSEVRQVAGEDRLIAGRSEAKRSEGRRRWGLRASTGSGRRKEHAPAAVAEGEYGSKDHVGFGEESLGRRGRGSKLDALRTA